MSSLRVRLVPVPHLARCLGIVRLPRIQVQLARGKRRSGKLGALVDTGATPTLASRLVAEMLGLTWATVTSVGQPFAVGGIAGGTTAYQMEADLILAPEAKEPILLRDAKVGFMDGEPAGYQLVIGQRCAFERLVLVHRNNGPDPYLILTRPSGVV